MLVWLLCRALDLDDIELVQMLLDEKKLDLDGAYALHYAAAYCNARTLARLLDLGSGGKPTSLCALLFSICGFLVALQRVCKRNQLL
jgi:hypothetical protein